MAVELIGSYEPGSPEWLALRKTGITGSEIGVIAGVNKWQSAYSLWAYKTGQVSDEQNDNESMLWGRLLEPVILERFATLHEDEFEVSVAGATYRNVETPWALANPDGFIVKTGTGEMGILEIKTAMYEEDWADGIPLTYQAQVQWYMRVFGVRFAYFAVLFHGNKYAEYFIEFDEFVSDTHFRLAEKFLACVRDYVAPDWDGSQSTYETVRKLHSAIDADEVCELGDLGVHYFNAVHAYNEASSLVNELKSRILDAMGNAKTGLVYDEPMLTRQARGDGLPFLVAKRGK